MLTQIYNPCDCGDAECSVCGRDNSWLKDKLAKQVTRVVGEQSAGTSEPIHQNGAANSAAELIDEPLQPATEEGAATGHAGSSHPVGMTPPANEQAHCHDWYWAAGQPLNGHSHVSVTNGSSFYGLPAFGYPLPFVGAWQAHHGTGHVHLATSASPAAANVRQGPRVHAGRWPHGYSSQTEV